MNDPYKALGVSPSATDEEITKTYRKLAQKYHPDLNPGNKAAEQRMKEINAAYEQVKKIRRGEASYDTNTGAPTGQYGSPFGYGGFDDLFEYLRRAQATGASGLRAVREQIQFGQYQQALYMLSGMQTRGAEWFFLSAAANAGMGNRVTAIAHAREAVRMAPDNHEFLSLLQQLEQGSTAYRQSGRGYGFDMQTAGKTMMQICLANMFCYFCCRPC